MSTGLRSKMSDFPSKCRFVSNFQGNIWSLNKMAILQWMPSSKGYFCSAQWPRRLRQREMHEPRFQTFTQCNAANAGSDGNNGNDSNGATGNTRWSPARASRSRRRLWWRRPGLWQAAHPLFSWGKASWLGWWPWWIAFAMRLFVSDTCKPCTRSQRRRTAR